MSWRAQKADALSTIPWSYIDSPGSDGPSERLIILDERQIRGVDRIGGDKLRPSKTSASSALFVKQPCNADTRFRIERQLSPLVSSSRSCTTWEGRPPAGLG